MSLILVLAASLVAAEEPAANVKQEMEKFQGTWVAVHQESEGTKAAEADTNRLHFAFSGEKLIIKGNFKDDREVVGRYKIDPSKKPKTIDVLIPNAPEPLLGIYELDGDQLKICMIRMLDRERPTDFVTKAGSRLTLTVFKRAKK